MQLFESPNKVILKFFKIYICYFYKIDTAIVIITKLAIAGNYFKQANYFL